MTGRIAARLAEKGLSLPSAPQPVATYIGYRVVGQEIWVAGVGPTTDGAVRYAGKVGRDLSQADGIKAAELTALNLLAHACHAAGGDLDRIERCARLFCLVNADPDYVDPQWVANGATDLMAHLFGDAGRPARTTIVAPSLPVNIAVEMDAVFLLKAA